MQQIASVQQRRYIKQELLRRTEYSIEVRLELTGNYYRYDLIRVLSPADLAPERWQSTASLKDLPVSPEAEFTSEELRWAGQRDSKGLGCVLAIVFVGAVLLTPTIIEGVRDLIFRTLIVAVVAILGIGFLALYFWEQEERSPAPEKLSELTAHKQSLREQRLAQYTSARTEFETKLENFDAWIALSPHEFELALSLRLEKEGFKVKTTRYSKDGGVDIDAIDAFGDTKIIQAKKYASNVGVATVREMIGVRANRVDHPKAMIYSLNGFSREAKELAKKHGIELRDIKSELLKI
jgi:HJR/Mrr/RecB family endonuclease